MRNKLHLKETAHDIAHVFQIDFISSLMLNISSSKLSILDTVRLHMKRKCKKYQHYEQNSFLKNQKFSKKLEQTTKDEERNDVLKTTNDVQYKQEKESKIETTSAKYTGVRDDDDDDDDEDEKGDDDDDDLDNGDHSHGSNNRPKHQSEEKMKEKHRSDEEVDNAESEQEVDQSKKSKFKYLFSFIHGLQSFFRGM